MINFIDEWICDGCGNIFDKTDVADLSTDHFIKNYIIEQKKICQFG